METKEPTLDQERASNFMTTAQILFAGGAGVGAHRRQVVS